MSDIYYTVCPVCKKKGSRVHKKSEVLGRIIVCHCLPNGNAVKYYVEQKHLKRVEDVNEL